MVNISKSGNSTKFVFTDSDHYLYGNGEIEVPVNSLLLVIDDSEMVTFKKLSGDPFISFDPSNSNLGTKAAIEQFYKENMVGSTGGGGDVTSGQVQSMIDESISGKADTTYVNQIAAQATEAITALTQTVSNNYTEHETEIEAMKTGKFGDVRYDSATHRINFYYDNSALSPLAYVDATDFIKDGMVSNVEIVNGNLVITFNSDAGKQPISIPLTSIFDPANYYTTAQTQSYVSGFTYDKATIDQKVAEGGTFDPDLYYDKTATNALLAAKADTATTYTKTEVDNALSGKADTSAVTAAVDSAKAYYISFATIATTGIRDEDWDGIVAAIDAHRPIYAGYPRNDGGILYYGVECMSKNVTNTEIVLTSSDENHHYFYTFTKNGSEDYAYTVDTKPYVPDITTAITSGSTDAEIPTAKAVYDATQSGGGMDDDTQQLISTALNDLNDRKADLTELSKYQKKGDYVKTSTLAETLSDYMTNASFDEYATANDEYVTAKERIISGALNDLDNRMTAVESGVSVTVDTTLDSGSTNPVANSAITTAIGAKVDTSAITTAITSGSTDSEIPTAKATYDAIQAGGGGATYSAGTNISIDTGNTINCTLPMKVYNNSTIAAGGVSNSIGSQYYSFTFGSSNNFAMSGNHYGFALGYANLVTNSYQCSVGYGAESNRGSSTFGSSGNTLFAVGNGGSGEQVRHNAFEVRQNGDIYFPDTDNTTYQNFNQKPMVRLQNMYAALGGLKLVKLTQSEYDALATKDSSTLYIISD